MAIPSTDSVSETAGALSCSTDFKNTKDLAVQEEIVNIAHQDNCKQSVAKVVKNVHRHTNTCDRATNMHEHESIVESIMPTLPTTLLSSPPYVVVVSVTEHYEDTQRQVTFVKPVNTVFPPGMLNIPSIKIAWSS